MTKRTLYVGKKRVGEFSDSHSDQLAMHDAFLKESRRQKLIERIELGLLAVLILVLAIM